MKRTPPDLPDNDTWDPGGSPRPQPDLHEERYVHGEILGRGGMGDVMRVHDRQLRRDVAMKILRADRDTAATRARFEQEAQVTGQLAHPNIVALHDTGHDQHGRPWFTMKQVDGESLDDVIRRWGDQVAAGQMTYEVALLRGVEILRRVCDAVAFAHSRGVVHRDLKPANVMVGAFGEVQVMDWGLARLQGDTDDQQTVSSDHVGALETQDGALAGTPAYMSPEQALGQNSKISPQTDVWAVGAMLYELLTFSRAFRGDVDTLLADVRGATVESPSARRPDLTVPHELEAVVRRSMQYAPAERYASVIDLSADLQAWVEGRPLASLRYSAPQLAWMWVRRNRALVTGAAIATGFAMLLGIGGTLRYVRDLSAAETEARLALAEGRVATAEALSANGRYADARQQFRAALPELRRLGADVTSAQLGLWATFHHSAPPRWRLKLDADAMALPGPTGRRFYVYADGVLEERAWPSGRIVRSWPRPLPGRLKGMRLENGKPVLYTRDEEGWLVRLVGPSGQEERLFQTAPGRLRLPDDPNLLLLVGGAPTPSSTAWRRDPETDLWSSTVLGEGIPESWSGTHVILTRQRPKAVRLVDLETGEEVRKLLDYNAYAALHGRTVYLFNEQTDQLQALDIQTGEERWNVMAKNITTVEVSEDGGILWASGFEGTVLAIDTDTGDLRGRLEGHTEAVKTLIALPQGLLSQAGSTWMGWSIPGAAPLGQITMEAAEAVAVSPDGRLLAVGADVIRVFDIDTGWLLTELPGTEECSDLDFVGTESLWISRRDSGANLWRLSDLEQIGRIEQPVETLAVDADARVWFGASDGMIGRTEADGTPIWTTSEALQSTPWDVLPLEDQALYSDFKSNALVVVDSDGTPVQRLETGRRSYTVARHGDLVATGTVDGKALIWNWRTGERVFALDGHDGMVLDVEFSTDGSYLATASFDWTVGIIDTATGERIATDIVHKGSVGTVSWLDDGRLVTGSNDDSVLVRDLELPERLRTGMALASRHAGNDAALTRRQAEQLARYAADRRDWPMAVLAAKRSLEGIPALERARWAALAHEHELAQTWLDEAKTDPSLPRSYLQLLQAALDREHATSLSSEPPSPDTHAEDIRPEEGGGVDAAGVPVAGSEGDAGAEVDALGHDVPVP